MQPLRALVLEGDQVRLEPATSAHAEALFPTVAEDTFRYMPFAVLSVDDLRRELERGEALAARGEAMPLLQRSRATGVVVGHTGYWSVAAPHGRVEVGMTWLAPAARRSAINTEAKLLLLGYAFEGLGARRVEFKTDTRNAGSRAALRRIGAVEEGVLRAHMVLPDGSVRDTVYYSVLAAEWPAVRARLQGLLGGR